MNRLVSISLPLGGRAVRIFSRKFRLPAQHDVYRAQSRADAACSARVVSPLMQRCCVSSGSAEPFMNGTSAIYIEEMYESWQNDPTSVHKSWDSFFTNVEQGYEPGVAYQSPPAVYGHPLKYEPVQSEIQPVPSTSSQVTDVDQQTTIDKHLAVSGLIRAYQTRGHTLAELDPLGILNADLDTRTPRELELETWKLSANDLDTEFRLPAFTRIGGTEERLKLSEIQKRLREVYCNNIGVEYLFLTSQDKKDWLREQFETPGVMEQTNKEKDRLVARLLRATEFESFLAKKWPSEKRFGLEGCEVMIPALKHIIDISTDNGVNNIIMGMPHRGRLNVLANVCRKPLEHLFSQFNTELAFEEDEDGSSTSGDVKYHLGMTHERMNRMNNKTVTMSLCANPSHLEAVDPIVQGKTKAEQFLAKSKDGKEVMSILLHGDAAFSGQGVVYETFHLSDLPRFTTHGTIHIVVNNQIGFTTDPRMSRSSPYCTDVAKVVQCPIFHVNADNPEAVMHVCKVAAEYRHKFGKDVVIDLVCYRKNGHNEGDNPDFTQPIMYQRIRKMEPVVAKYSDQLIAQGVITRDEFNKKVSEYYKILNDAFDGAKENPRIKNADWLDSKWGDFFNPNDVLGTLEPTGIKMNDLEVLARKFATEPGHIKIHSGLKRVFKQRREMLDNGVADWAIGEYLAFSSLLKEGVHVRISGQDVERGTFSHRHHIIHDQIQDKLTYDMLSEVSENQAEYEVCNSSLSEYAVLGFELGYSMTNPQFLCIWEAQFGDFMNTAQCIIDQFISSGQDKWVRQSGLVMLLPHGMEGMGPEHSSARPERFLQMTKEDSDTFPDYDLKEFELQQNFQTNWFICNITTPANFFHVLRRQVKLAFRKPLIVLTPKSLLRLESARSPLTEMAEDTTFQRVIPEDGPGCTGNPENVKKLILCTGKIYYELKKEREQVGKTDDIAITRVEQIAPFPFDLIREEMRKYPNAAIQWVQEEHKNHGYWQHVKPRIEACCDETDSRRPSYTGRATSASPATGNKKIHKLEAQHLLEDAMAL